MVTACLWLVACQPDNYPPSLAFLEDQTVFVGESLQVSLKAIDMDRDILTFTVEGLTDDARIEPTGPQQATLVWNPGIMDGSASGTRWTATVTVSDGKGGHAQQPFDVIVFPRYGVPAFDLPGGVTLNLGQEDDLALRVSVKDDDSTMVQLTLDEAPDGAILDSSGDKEAWFYWKPTEAQKSVAIHRAVFSAVDETHPPVSHVLIIILLNHEVGSGCPGGPPMLFHDVPADETLASDGTLQRWAWVADLHSKVGPVTLHWTTGDPSVGTWQEESLAYDEGVELWETTLNPSLGASGALLHYYITAWDDDDPYEATCDHVTRLPKVGWMTSAAYPASGGSCLDDPNEPDGDADGAPTLSAGLYDGRRLCGLDTDTARVVVDAGDRLTVQLTRPWAHHPLDLRLVDSLGEVVTQASGDETLIVDHMPTTDTDLYIQVQGQHADGRSSYSLMVAKAEVGCSADLLEPNDVPADAVSLTEGPEALLRLCPGESDWYAISMNGGDRLRLQIDFEHAYGDLELDLRTSDELGLLATSWSTGSGESVNFTNLMGPRMVLARVWGHLLASNTYGIDLVIEAAGTFCDDDLLAPQSTPELGIMLFQGLYEGLVACPDSPDWFAVDVNGGETLTVAVERVGEGQAPELDVFWEDPYGPPTMSPEADADLRWAELEDVSPGRYWYRVGATAGMTPYLLLQTIEDPEGPCGDDRFEPNDDETDATLTAGGMYTWLRLCPGDRDVFLVELAPYTTLTVLTSHGAEGGYTDVSVLDPAGETIAEALDYDRGVSVEAVGQEGGFYQVRVDGFDVTSLGYDLRIIVH